MNKDMYIKTISDFVSELRNNIFRLEDTVIDYRRAFTLAEALTEIDIEDKVYARDSDLRDAIERCVHDAGYNIADNVIASLNLSSELRG